MTDTDSSLDVLLSTLRTNFLAEIPERCENIEENILALESQKSFTEAFNDLYRSIHSLKGSGGTMGLPIITAISHQFEDMLSEIDGKFEHIQQDSIDIMLKYNDLLNSTAIAISDKTFNDAAVQQVLETLKASSRRQEISCMIIEPSKLLTHAITKVLKGLSIHVTVINNGMEALERLLNEKFDILISSKELPVLNGVALICALRRSETKNANIPCFITTSKDINPSLLKGLDISFVVKKDKNLTEDLSKKIKAIKMHIA